MNINIDSHKLIYHTERLADFLKGKTVYPIYCEITLTNKCNINCGFCALDYRRKQKRSLNYERVIELLSEFKSCGVKSLCFAGEGEPLLYEKLPDVLNETKKKGIDAALMTNGVLINDSLALNFSRNLVWIRVSLNAFKNSTYKRIHGTKTDISRVFKNIEKLLSAKKKTKSKITIGVQSLLLPENEKEIFSLATFLKNTGVDYFTVKPFHPNPNSVNNYFKKVNYEKYLKFGEELEKINSRNYKVYFRSNAFKKESLKIKEYKSCLGVNFFCVVGSEGSIYSCIQYVGNKNYCYGNIYESSFKRIWNSAERAKIVEKLRKNTKKCLPGCRLDEINIFLNNLTRLPEHVNFI